jgi:hypothetical protein
LGEATRKLLNRNQGFPVKIISLVRDPVALIVSGIFQNPYFAGELAQTDLGSIDPQKASEYIAHKLSDPNTFAYVYGWFDRELRTVFGIDVFASPFPSETGYAVYSKGNVEALVIRLEDLSEKGPNTISDFLGLGEPLVLKKSNVRASSNAKGVYQQVKEHVSLSLSLCKTIYSSKFVTHFYNEAMIDKFTSNWVGAVQT